MNLVFARGDSYEKGFVLQDQKLGGRVITEFDEVYFTVKESPYDKMPVLQKKMSDGGIINDGDGHYTLHILPDDTNHMSFRDYDFDLEFVKGDNEYKKSFVGRLTLTKEITHKSDEGDCYG